MWYIREQSSIKKRLTHQVNWQLLHLENWDCYPEDQGHYCSGGVLSFPVVETSVVQASRIHYSCVKVLKVE